MPVYPFEDDWPEVAETCFIAPNASVIGRVAIGPDSSIWFGTVIRGDVFHVEIGAGTNIQDNSVIHVTSGKHATLVGNHVTVGHRALLHGCTVEDGALIGMGAIVMDRAVIGQGSLIAAGSLVTEGTIIPPGSLAMGAPAKVRRELSPEEVQHLLWSAEHYMTLSKTHASRLGWGQGHR